MAELHFEKALDRSIRELEKMIELASDYDMDEMHVQALRTAIESMQLRKESPPQAAGGEPVAWCSLRNGEMFRVGLTKGALGIDTPLYLHPPTNANKSGEPVAWRHRYLCPEEGPSVWNVSQDESWMRQLMARNDYEVRRLYDHPHAVVPPEWLGDLKRCLSDIAQEFGHTGRGNRRFVQLLTRVEATRWRQAAVGQEWVVPEGWQLVPIEPTREMWNAANKADDDAYIDGSAHGAGIAELWDVMLAAAPAQPAGGGAELGEDWRKLHGHVKARPDGAKARCGGPSMCRICNAELDAVNRQEKPNDPS